MVSKNPSEEWLSLSAFRWYFSFGSANVEDSFSGLTRRVTILLVSVSPGGITALLVSANVA